MLNEKRKKILSCIVDYYIKTGKPLGSSNLIKIYNLNLSPSTIRNEFKALMKEGLLTQKHVSSGRVPTEKGIRAHIDDILTLDKYSKNVIDLISKQYGKLDGTLDQVIKRISNLLSEFTHSACLVTLPNTRLLKIQSFKIVELSDKRLIVILVFEGGITEKTYIKLDSSISSKEMAVISDYLNQLTYGLTLDEVKSKILEKFKYPKKEYSFFVEKVVKLSIEILEKEKDIDILINGKLTHFEDNALDNPEISKNLLHVFEHKDFLSQLLDKVVEGKGTKVFVGSHNGMPTGCSLIAAPYGVYGSEGSLGVFGPIRMNYSKIIPMVDYTARYLSEIITGAKSHGTWK